MPELPEVETMVRGLRPALEGRRLRRLDVRDPFLLEGCTALGLVQRAHGARVVRVHRRGKWVVVTLDGRAGIIVIQPRMTGGFWLVEPTRPEHIRLTFELDGTAEKVWFCDARRLGKIALYDDAGAAAADCARSHGPDALAITRDELAAALRRTRRGIKPALLDQRVLAGVGNIYADEILHRAGLHPERPADRLRPGELDRLHAAIRPVLEEAIAAEGSSFDAGYRTVLGLEGGFLAGNAVHRRRGLPCPACREPIVKARIAGLIGRPTYYCPRCQPPRPRRGRSPAGPKPDDRVS
jgi:formamidopyrimidine-DNA glycosylase